MKFFAAFALILAVASAGIIKPGSNDEAQIQAIVAAIASPSTDPATAILLEQQLAEILGITPPSPAIVDIVDPVNVIDEAVFPVVVVDQGVSPVVVVDEAAPIAEETAPIAPVVNPVAPIVNPTPVSSPLVQVILNINAPAGAVDVSPVVTPVIDEVAADSVNVVDEAINEIIVPEVVVLPPTLVVEPVMVAEPVIVAEPVFPAPVSPIIVGEPSLPVVVSPVIIGEPTLPVQPAVTLPEILN